MQEQAESFAGADQSSDCPSLPGLAVEQAGTNRVEGVDSLFKESKKMTKLLIVALLAAFTGANLSAREPLMVPAQGGELALASEPTLLLPMAEPQGTPVPYAEYVVEASPVIELYTNVRVRDRKNIHPCAVSKIVQVVDPCDKCCKVFVEICVPPCANETVRCYRNGDRLRFCYGEYSVDVTTRRYDVVVNYND